MKQKNFFVKLSLFVLISMPLGAINPKLLKGTILLDMDSAYAPFWGLIMWEEQIAKQFYNLSVKHMKNVVQESLKDTAKDTTEEGSATADQEANNAAALKILEAQKNSATEDLITHMFHESGGTFNITNASNNPVKLLTPKDIGNILRMVSNNKADYKKMETVLKKYLNDLLKTDKRFADFKHGDLNKFVNALVGAVKECSIDNPARTYSENTAQEIVLGYLLAKSNIRQDLQDYLSAFTGKSVVLSDEQYDEQNFDDILQKSVDLNDVEEFSDFVCAMTYAQKYQSLLPKIVPNSRVKYQNIEFSDCVETTIRNLCNIETWSSEKQTLGKISQGTSMNSELPTFDDNELNKNSAEGDEIVEGLTMNKELQTFYDNELNKDSAEVGNVKVHQAWVDLVENVLGMLYGNLLVPGTKSVLNVKSFCDGVMPVDKIDSSLPAKSVTIDDQNYKIYEKKIGSKTYWLIPKDGPLHCYELTTTTLNIIVALNNFFNLKLYSSVDDILQADFAQKYFQTMCTKLGWQVSEEEMQKIIDLEQGKIGHITISVELVDGGIFKIDLQTKEHSFVSVDAGEEVSSQISLDQIEQADGMTQAACVSLNIVDNDDLTKLQSDSLLYKSILNPDDRLQMIQDLLQDSITLAQHEKYIAKLIMSMGDLADEHYQNEVLVAIQDDTNVSKSIAQAMVVMTTIASLKYDYSEVSVLYSKILLNDESKQNNIKKLCTLINQKMDKWSLGLVSDLIEKGLIEASNVQDVLNLADQGIKHVSFLVRQQAVTLVSDLTGKKLIDLDFVLNLADKWLKSDSLDVQDSAFSLVSILIDKGLIETNNVQNLLNFVNQGMKSSHSPVQAEALKCIFVLIDKGLIEVNNMQDVLNWIDQGIKHYHPLVQEYACKVISSLLNKKLIDTDQAQDLFDKILPIEKAAKNVSLKNQIDSVKLALKRIISKVTPAAEATEATEATEAEKNERLLNAYKEYLAKQAVENKRRVDNSRQIETDDVGAI